MNATITPTRAKAKPAVVEQPAAPALPWWLGPTTQARDALSTLLNEAYHLDLPDEDSDSNYALRLLGMAAAVVDDEMLPAEMLNAEDPQNTVAEASFNCIALLRATLVHPDGSFDIRRRTWVQHALSILNVMTSMHMSGAKGQDYVPTLERAVQTAPPELASVQPPQAITRDTELVQSGDIALSIVSHATWDIEPLSDALLDVAGELGGVEAGLVRCYALRIKHLNSIVMSYLTDDSITVDESHQAVFGRPFPEGVPA
ncbi:hypothetical protein RD110_07885 [Rhodoferax koreense]|uniref:Uncharacterized protein n=1 Tax=Rhodoferax koreensis TaxID=1842727 RepID=A0A1P8JTR1_9BURK|nr:hypothetical protein [Rhodoferax koreense]APW37123.1 hypothetical protein RD110_07885 [Rhodoferax koreense]